ncbi:U3 small nucleolar RNA-associated protein 6 homolog [Procambarus clarkii]|uniref:U3 small nucleolar RNA-associated protein 6 homolog n=1 Tax=Procambarus clarkii TaxID=6728 RepID=UPI001E671BEB|nr:U3 small nucleolar RNA-associated protein 6 homolog [Procambarus clarkii]
MAEFVEQRIEETIPEMEEMERIGLLAPKEVKKLIQKRRDFQYRLARRSKNKSDFFNYINYERKLIELIRIRRKQIGIHEKRKQIETAISKRVIRQLRYVTRVWPSHLDTWKLRICFAQFIGWKEEISSTFAEQIRYHSNQENVWVAWAKWEIEERQNFDKARTILLSKASLHHPKSRLIKRELFRLELLYVEFLMNKLKNDNIAGLEEIIAENREKVLNCAVAKAVYKDAVSSLPDPELYLELYQVADKFEYAHTLRDEIYRDLSDKFTNADGVWKLRAQRKALGLPEMKSDGEKSDSISGKVSEDKEAEMENGSEETKIRTEDLSDSEEKDSEASEEKNVIDNKVMDVILPRSLEAVEKLECIMSTFDEAIQVIGGTFVNTYCAELLPLLYQCWGETTMADLIFKKLISLCEAHTSVLSPLIFFIWSQVLCEMSRPVGEMQSVLEEALKCHPEVAHLRLKFVQLITRTLVNKEMMEEFDKVAVSMKGECGLQAWMEVIKHVSDDLLRTKMFLQAVDHEDPTVSQGMRVQYLKQTGLQKGIKSARKLYRKLSWRPPFTARLHAMMVEFELAEITIDAEEVRQVFNNALQQHGTTHPGVWLAYIQFEKRHGDPLKTGGLYTRAEKELEANHAHIFRELNITIRELLEEVATSVSDDENKSILIENLRDEDSEEVACVCKPALATLYKEELILSKSADEARKRFFLSINSMEKQISKGNTDAPKEDGSEWEHVLQILIGHKIALSVQQVKIKPLASEQNITPEKDMIFPRFKNRYQPTDQLELEESESVKSHQDKSVEKILETSAVLKPEFMQKTHLSPYFIGKKKAKEQRKRESEKTKGPGWFDMKAPELTEEVKRDLEVLQMRSVLDPKRHYKNSDMKVLPKYFQLGRVVDNPVEFYSSRVLKKDRKRTLAEEIIHDEESLRYQKRKYNEIIAAKQKKVIRHQGQRKKTGKKVNKKDKSRVS